MPAVHVTPIPREEEADTPTAAIQSGPDADRPRAPADIPDNDNPDDAGQGAAGQENHPKAEATPVDAPDADASDAGDSDGEAAVPATDDTSTQSIAVVKPDSAVKPGSAVEPGSDDNSSTAAGPVVDSASR